MAIGFPMRRSHQLIATPIAPLAAPVCRPRLVVSLGSPCVCSFLVLSLRSFHLVIPSSRLILLSFLSSSRRCLPHSWRRIGSWGRQLGWRRAFLDAPFSSAHYRSPRHQVLIIGGAAPDRCGFDGAVSTVPSHHLIRLVSLVPIATSSHHGAEALVSVVFQASNYGMAVPRLIISSHHLIPSPSWSVLPVISSHASRRASLPHIPGHQRRTG